MVANAQSTPTRGRDHPAATDLAIAGRAVVLTPALLPAQLIFHQPGHETQHVAPLLRDAQQAAVVATLSRQLQQRGGEAGLVDALGNQPHGGINRLGVTAGVGQQLDVDVDGQSALLLDVDRLGPLPEILNRRLDVFAQRGLEV